MAGGFSDFYASSGASVRLLIRVLSSIGQMRLSSFRRDSAPVLENLEKPQPLRRFQPGEQRRWPTFQRRCLSPCPLCRRCHRTQGRRRAHSRNEHNSRLETLSPPHHLRRRPDDFYRRVCSDLQISEAVSFTGFVSGRQSVRHSRLRPSSFCPPGSKECPWW